LFFTPPNLIGLESFNLATGAVATARIQINFQTNGIPPPPGYLADEGQIFEDRGNGFSYGWSADRSSHARIQNSAISPDTRYDSFILMESAGGAFWQIELTNGVYRVHLAVGDPLNFNGTYAIEVQGMPALSGMPETGNAWVEGSTVVLVTNGTLTVRSATGSLNNRLCFLDITAVSPPEMLPPSPVNSMEWQVNFLGDPHVAHDIESSSDLIEWTTLGPADVFSKNHFRLSVPVGTNVHQFFRARIVVPSPDP
jgi:hypothetical protein